MSSQVSPNGSVSNSAEYTEVQNTIGHQFFVNIYQLNANK